MDPRRPISRGGRRLLSVIYLLALTGALAYVVRLAQEPAIAMGFDVTSDGIVGSVAAGSAGREAGLRVGDIVSENDFSAFFNGERPTTITVLRDGHPESLVLSYRTTTLAERLANLPWYRYVLLAVGLITLVAGWWLASRNPDAPGIVPFVLWSASAALVYPTVGPSAIWSADMWGVLSATEILFNGLFQAASLHWILRFPRPLGGRGPVVACYGISAALALWLALEARTAYPVEALHLRAAVVGVVNLVLCAIQLSRAHSRRMRRQATWVLAAVATYAMCDLLLWELPHLLGIDLGATGTINAMAGLTYLVVPLGISIAVTREGLFGIDRFVTPGLAYGAAVAALALGYAAIAFVVAEALGLTIGTLPTGLSIALVALLAALFLPVHRKLFAVLDRVFNRPESNRRTALAALERRIEEALTAEDLERALTTTLKEALDLTGCSRDPSSSKRAIARPGVLDVGSTAWFDLAPDLDCALRIPLGGASGTLCVGLREGGGRFSDDNLSLVQDAGRRYVRASERLALLRELADRELEVARTRLRIAGDLHDDIGASLASMAVLSDLVRRNESLPVADRNRLERLSSSARGLVDNLRDIVWSIDPDADRAQDLVARLRDAADALLPGIRCTVDSPENGDTLLPMDTRRQLFLIAKEALHNVSRHADASEVLIGFSVSQTEIVLRIADNGRGFDVAAGSGGHGLGSMKARAESMGGEFGLESGTGGTVLTVVLMRDSGDEGSRSEETRSRQAAVVPKALS